MQRVLPRLSSLRAHLNTTRYYSTEIMSSGEKAQKVPREQQKDLHLLTMNTPSTKKAQIGLEECKALYGTDFSFEVVNIMTNAQKEDWFLKLNPNGRIPVLVDNKVENGSSEPFGVMETAAILLYLAKRVDKNDTFGFKDELERNQCLQWMFWQMGGQGPMQGQLNHFGKYAKEKIPYGIKRYHDETLRLIDVLDLHLSGKFNNGVARDYLVGSDNGNKGKYSWADICCYPWAALSEGSGIEKEELEKRKHFGAWLDRIAARPAVQTGSGSKYDLPK